MTGWVSSPETRGGPKAYAGVPIAVGGKVIGVLAVQNYERDDAYDEHTIELLSAIANQAAIAIENARLYKRPSSWPSRMALLVSITAISLRRSRMSSSGATDTSSQFSLLSSTSTISRPITTATATWQGTTF